MLKKRHTNFNLTDNFERHIMAKQDNKTFTVAGTATNPDGTTKARFANDLVARIKILNKAKCTAINLMELPSPMTKLEAVKVLKTADEFQGAAEQSAIADYLDRKDETPAKATKAVAPAKTATVKAPKVKAAIKASKIDTSEMEDAPF